MHNGSFKSSVYIWIFMGLNFSKGSGKGLVSFKPCKMTQESYDDLSLSAIHKILMRIHKTRRITS
jgi:hypothetical protein